MKGRRETEDLAETSTKAGRVEAEMLKVLLRTIAQTGRSDRGLNHRLLVK